ncbi:MAG: hypothetical protein KJP16_09110 [Gammaproteobacteria bacterium]|nr:hypothetical protein [Gammaproteobacteria bacterium]NNL50962.1 hypothetical protein [Woeseiaceae bacterium]
MDSRLNELDTRLTAVEQRLSRLEGEASATPVIDEVEAEPTIDRGFLSSAPTLVGRVLLIFGGAYLLRAITEFQVVPTALGISLGAAYALFWLYMAYRKGSDAAEGATALFYGGASVLLAMPLVVEASGRFELLSGAEGIVALTILCAASLWVAAARDLRLLGWLVTAGGIGTALVIMRLSRSTVPASAFLIFLGIAVLWACYLRRWSGPRWLGAIGANAGVLALALLSTSDQWTVAPLSAFVLGAVLFGAYLLSFALHSHVRGQFVGVFEATQALLAVVVAFVAASVAGRAGQLAMTQVGVLCLVLAAAAYALAFTPETRNTRGRNFFFYSSLGLLLLVIGSALVLSPAVAAAAWSLLALAMAWFSGRYGRVALSLQCTFLLLAAGISSGILETGFLALAGGSLDSWPPLVPWHPVVALTTVACLFIPVAQHSERWGVMAGLPQLLVLALSVWEVGGLMVAYVAPVAAGVGSPESDPAVLAALRTAVLAVASVTLALSSRHKRWPEARWLVYPVLILVGVKLFLEDFPHGQPVTLFVALALVGSALILVARLLGRDNTAV